MFDTFDAVDSAHMHPLALSLRNADTFISPAAKFPVGCAANKEHIVAVRPCKGFHAILSDKTHRPAAFTQHGCIVSKSLQRGLRIAHDIGGGRHQAGRLEG